MREWSAATGRPDDEVHDRRRQQADRGRGDRPADRQRAEQHRADDRGADEPPTEVPERAGEVRRRHGDRRAGDGDRARRERGRTVEAHEPPRRAPGAPGDEHVQAERGEPAEDDPGHHRGEQHHAVTCRGDHDQGQRPPERRPDEGRPQRLEEVRQRLGERHGSCADVARHRVQHADQHDDEGGEDRQRDVGGTPGRGSCEPDANSSRPPERRRAIGGRWSRWPGSARRASVGIVGTAVHATRGPSRSPRLRRSGAPEAGRHRAVPRRRGGPGRI